MYPRGLFETQTKIIFLISLQMNCSHRRKSIKQHEKKDQNCVCAILRYSKSNRLFS